MNRTAYRLAFVATLLVVSPLGAQTRAPKIYIAADMEGVVGTVTGDQLGPSGFEYSRFRQFMTQEVLAAIRGARQAGAGEIIVSDSHGNAENLLIEDFPEDVTIVRSWPRPHLDIQGMDSSFAGFIMIGFHAGTTNLQGVRAHTVSSARLADLRLNGRSMPEAVVEAAAAGHFGVPTIMISGDDASIAEARNFLPDFEAAVTKWAISFHSARTITPAASYKLVEQKAATAVRRLREIKPFVLPKPVTLEIRFKSYRPAEMLAYLPIVERVDAHSIRYVGKDMLEVSKFIGFVNTYSIELEP